MAPVKFSKTACEGRLWKEGKRRPTAKLSDGIVITLGSRFFSGSFNRIGEQIALVDEHGSVMCCNLQMGSWIRLSDVTGAHSSKSSLICFSPRHKNEVGVVLASRNGKREACMVDISNNETKILARFAGHRHEINSLSFHPSNTVLVTASVEKLLVWDTTSWTKRRELGAGPGIVKAQFTPRGDLLLVLFRNGSLCAWGAQDYDLKAEFKPLDGSPLEDIFCISPDSRFVITVAKNTGKLFVWEIHTKVEYLPDGTSLGVLSEDGVVRVLNTKDVRLNTKRPYLCVFEDRMARIVKFEVGPNGKHLLLLQSDRKAKLVDMGQALAGQARRMEKLHRMGTDHPETEFQYGSYELQSPSTLSESPSEAPASGSRGLTRQGQQKGLVVPVASVGPKKQASPKFTRPKGSPKGSPKGRGPERDVLDEVFKATVEPTKLGMMDEPAAFAGYPLEGETLNRGDPTRWTSSAPAAAAKLESKKWGKKPTPVDSETWLQVSANMDIQDKALNAASLNQLLTEFGEFPAKYRLFIWQFLLQLPKKIAAFNRLARLGMHPAWKDLHVRFPLQNERVSEKLTIVMSCLAHWCPLFSQVDYLPHLVFPIVKLFAHDVQAAFETTLRFISTWCATWFVNYPDPPVKVLLCVEEFLRDVDPELLEHLKQQEVGSETYAWPLLRTLFSEVLTKFEWLKFWDHCVARAKSPEFLVVACGAYLVHFRTAIMSIREKSNFEKFFHAQNPFDVNRWLAETYDFLDRDTTDILQTALEEVRPSTIVSLLAPTGAAYFRFSAYPKYVVELKAQEATLAELALEETKREETLLRTIEQRSAALETAEKTWRSYQEKLLQAETARRAQAIVDTEQKLLDKKRLAESSRLKRLEQIARMENAAAANLDLQTKLRETESARLLEDMEAAAKNHQLEIEDLLEQDKVLALELQSLEKVSQLQAERQLQHDMQELRSYVNNWEKQQEAELKARSEAAKLQDEQRKLRLAKLKQDKENQLREAENRKARLQVEAQVSLQKLDQEQNLAKVERERRLRQMQEDDALRRDADLAKQEELSKLLMAQDEAARAKIIVDQTQWLDELRADQANRLTAEKLKMEKESAARAERLLELERRQRLRQFEQQVARKMATSRKQVLEEEKKQQQLILEMEQQRRNERKMELELLFKEQELKERAAFVKTSKEAQERALEKDRQKFMQTKDDLRLKQAREEASAFAAHEEVMAQRILERERQLAKLGGLKEKDASINQPVSSEDAQDVSQSQTSQSELSVEEQARAMLHRHEQLRKSMMDLET